MLAAAQAKEVANAPYSEFEQIMGDEGFLAMLQRFSDSGYFLSIPIRMFSTLKRYLDLV